jgi:hypothetical protein
MMLLCFTAGDDLNATAARTGALGMELQVKVAPQLRGLGRRQGRVHDWRKERAPCHAPVSCILPLSL